MVNFKIKNSIIKIIISKLILWIILTFIIIFISTSFITERNFEKIEIKSLDKTFDLITYSILDNAKKLSIANNDYSNWQESYDFVTNTNIGFTDENLKQETLQNLDIDFILFLDKNNKIFYYDKVNKNVSESPEEMFELFLDINDVNKIINNISKTPTFLAYLNLKPLLVSLSPIRPFTGGPIGGTLIMAKYINQKSNGFLLKTSNVTYTIKKAYPDSNQSKYMSFSGKLNLDNKTIYSQRFLEEYNSFLFIEKPLDFYAEKIETHKTIYISIFVIYLLLIFIIAKILYSTTLNKIVILAKKIKNENLDNLHLEANNLDEIQQLEHTIDQLIIKNHDKNLILKQQNEQDFLTGIGNRRKVVSTLTDLISKKPKESYFLALIDLDDFKLINDTYGHPAGDYALKHVSKVMTKNNKENDSSYRLGGDEFAVIFSESNPTLAKNFIENLRLKILEPTHWENKTFNINCSIGITSINNKDTTTKILTEADIALYKAKNLGKHCIEIN